MSSWGGSTAVETARAVVALAAVVLCLLYGRYVEPDWLEVTTTRVPTARLPSGHRGVRIVHLSDMHSMPAPRLEGGWFVEGELD